MREGLGDGGERYSTMMYRDRNHLKILGLGFLDVVV